MGGKNIVLPPAILLGAAYPLLPGYAATDYDHWRIQPAVWGEGAIGRTSPTLTYPQISVSSDFGQFTLRMRKNKIKQKIAFLSFSS